LGQRFDGLIGKLGVTKEHVTALTEAYKAQRLEEFRGQIIDAAAAFDPLLAAQNEYTKNLKTLIFLQRKVGGDPSSSPIGLEGVNFAQLFVEETEKFELAELEALARVQTGYDAFFTGVKLGFRQFSDSLGTDATIIAGGIGNIFTAASTAMTSFLETGKFSLRSFAQSMIQVIQQIVVQLLILAAVRAIAGVASAGASTATDSALQAGGGNNFAVASFAHGGQARSGRPAIVGERGPELFVPPSTGNIVPNGQMGGGATNVTIVNVQDASEVARMVGSAEGEKAIMNVISKNRGRVKQSIA
jgi:hypothetical protein